MLKKRVSVREMLNELRPKKKRTIERIEYLRKLNPGRFKKADKMASVMGDTFINHNTDAPSIQWFRILSMLREHGYEVRKHG